MLYAKVSDYRTVGPSIPTIRVLLPDKWIDLTLEPRLRDDSTESDKVNPSKYPELLLYSHVYHCKFEIECQNSTRMKILG